MATQAKLLKPILVGVVIGMTVLGAVWALVALISDHWATPEQRLARAQAQGQANSGVLDLICELQLDLDGQLSLGINASEPSRMTLAQVDFDRTSGWYQGRLAISEGRAGNLVVQGDELRVSRPAMFQRFGVTINREEFVVNRKTGNFVQSVSIQDGRTVTLIRGTCAKVIKPPF